MALYDLIQRPVTGIRPFNELAIDADIWREAHDHHHQHRRLHALSAHRPGIVYGLEVLAAGEDRIVVAPGVGVDDDGQTLVLSEPVTFTLAERGQLYVTLAFQRTADSRSAVDVAGGQQHYRLVEGRDIRAAKDLPTTPYLELARVYRTNTSAPIREAADSFDPVSDELNLLHRQVAFPHCYADCVIGEVPYVPRSGARQWKPNRAGLWNLLRTGNGSGFHLTFTGPVPLRQAGDIPDDRLPALLYIAGQEAFNPLADAEVDGLRQLLAVGTCLFGEASGGNAEFAEGFAKLASQIGANLQPVAATDPLLRAHHLFAGPPPGGQEQGLLLADSSTGVLLSTYDYGAAWQGVLAGAPGTASRERIRQAEEFGLNIIAWAARRQRRAELQMLL
jgi:hypothetical protein